MRDAGLDTPVVVLAYDAREAGRLVERARGLPIDRVFLWQGDVRIVPAIVKYVEDRWNVAHDTGVFGVQAILVVEDNVRYYSSFLPTIYAELMHHAHNLVPEGVNLSHKLMRLQAQPKILLCGTYEDAWRDFVEYEDHILGIISDIEFPRGGVNAPDAGLELARRVRERQPDIPVMLQSSRPENQALARSVGASFLVKGSPTLLQQLRRFMVEQLGLRRLRLPPAGRTRGGARARPARARGAARDRAGREPRVSRRAEPLLELVQGAHRVRARRAPAAAEGLGIRDGRAPAPRADARDPGVPPSRARGVVVDFDPATYDPEATFCRLGGGSLGGKARGLAFVELLARRGAPAPRFPGVRGSACRRRS